MEVIAKLEKYYKHFLLLNLGIGVFVTGAFFLVNPMLGVLEFIVKNKPVAIVVATALLSFALYYNIILIKYLHYLYIFDIAILFFVLEKQL